MPHSAKSEMSGQKTAQGRRDCLRPRSEIRGKWLRHGESPTLSHQLFNGRPKGYDIGRGRRAGLRFGSFVRARPSCASLVRHLGPVHRRAGECQSDARTTITSGFTESMKIASFRSRPRSQSTRNVFWAIVCSQVRSQNMRRRALASLVVGLALAGMALGGCATGPSGSSSSGHATAQDLLALNRIQDASGIKTRELLPEEKQVISKR